MESIGIDINVPGLYNLRSINCEVKWIEGQLMHPEVTHDKEHMIISPDEYNFTEWAEIERKDRVLPDRLAFITNGNPNVKLYCKKRKKDASVMVRDGDNVLGLCEVILSKGKDGAI